MNLKNKYDDIINLEHPTSKKHPRMSLENRSAQFAPFSALTGYEDEIKEETRVTENKISISEEEKEEINKRLNLALENLNETIVTITYFEKDSKKQGGKYKDITGKIKKIDNYAKTIKMESGEIIKIEELKKVEIL